MAQPRIGFVGFGEVAFGLTRGFRQAGVREIAAFDTGLGGPFDALIRGRAAETGVRLVESNAALCAGADLIISAVTATEARAAAEATAPHLRPGMLYVDVNSVTPRDKQAIAGLAAARGARGLDAALMDSPAAMLHQTVTFVAGEAAERLRDLLAPFGTDIRVVGQEPGQAAAIKMCRSIVMKGLEALMLEAFLTARRHGILDRVLGTIGEFLDRASFAEIARLLVTTDAVAALRRAHETEKVMEVMAEVGVEPVMTRATAARLFWSAGLGLRERFGGKPPAEIEEVLGAIEERLQATGGETG
jgi:3-hydroxyisobutyrate dehydrogenase-like beta-hydroxyacid dehydrogenase